MVSGTQTFAYHRSVAPMMWVLVVLASFELIVTHLLVALLVGRTPALVLSAVTLAGMVWLGWVVASMRRLPVTLNATRLVMGAGRLKSVEVPVEAIAGIRQAWDGTELKERGTLNLALIAYPNVLIDLDPPIAGRRRTIRTVAHRLDDAVAFTRAVERLVAER